MKTSEPAQLQRAILGLRESQEQNSGRRMIPVLIITLLLGAGVIVLIFAVWKGSSVKEWMAGARCRPFLGEKHRRKLDDDTSNTQNIQESLLLETLRRHQNTEYGQKYNFKDLKDVSSFQKLHPLTQYGDYKDYMERTKAGEDNVLLPGRPSSLIATAGTSGSPSLVPISVQNTKDRFLQGTAVYLEVIHSYFPGALEKVAKFRLAPNANHSKAGIPITSYPLVYSSSFLEQIYTQVPVQATMSYHQTLYTQLLFTLMDPKIHVLEANYSWLLRYIFTILEENWQFLITDIQRGRLNPEFILPLNIRKQIEDCMVPNADRAEELCDQFQKGFLGIARRVWPNLQLVIAVESGGSDLDRQILKDTVCQGVTVYSPIYCAAEGLFGVNLWPLEDVPRYVLCPRSAFFEFVSIGKSDQDQPRTQTVQDVSEGEAYELLITNTDGLYRYRLGDIVQVTGFHNQSPIVQFLYRKSQTLNVRGERISERGFYKSLLSTVDIWPGASLLNYCCAESGILGPFCGSSDPHYEVFVALKGVRDLSEEQRYKLDQTLQEHFPIYKSFRFKGSIGPVRVHLVRPKACLKLMELVASLSGAPLDCVQLPRTLRHRELAECIWKQVLS
ncbi:GH3 domain-containing protein [Gastrophryne carolinensis]